MYKPFQMKATAYAGRVCETVQLSLRCGQAYTASEGEIMGSAHNYGQMCY